MWAGIEREIRGAVQMTAPNLPVGDCTITPRRRMDTFRRSVAPARRLVPPDSLTCSIPVHFNQPNQQLPVTVFFGVIESATWRCAVRWEAFVRTRDAIRGPRYRM